MSTIKILATLLHYPDDRLQAHSDDLIAALDDEGLINGARRAAVVAFIERLRGDEILDLQAEYVETFDRGRARSLYLYEHVHGESRDRGQAMVELTQVYRAHGFEITASELPDYLPLFLEFLSSQPLEEAIGWLEDVGHVLQLLHARLVERASPYAVVLEPLVRLAGLAPEDSVREQVAKETPDDTPEALDRVWMEAPVTFGPEEGCGSGRRAATQTVKWHSARSH